MSALQEPRQTPVWTLGERMKKSRGWAHLSRGQMADALHARGIHASEAAIYKWESDKHLPSTRRSKGVGEHTVTTHDVLRAWADITNVDREFLNPLTYFAWYAQPLFDINTQCALTAVG